MPCAVAKPVRTQARCKTNEVRFLATYKSLINTRFIMAKKSNFHCFRQMTAQVAVYRRPSKGKASLSLNDYVAYTTRNENKPVFYKGGKEVSIHKSKFEK